MSREWKGREENEGKNRMELWEKGREGGRDRCARWDERMEERTQ